jgi:hypothetical protein
VGKLPLDAKYSLTSVSQLLARDRPSVTCADGVILIGRDCDRCQDADDRYDDHQFDERKALLYVLHGELL